MEIVIFLLIILCIVITAIVIYNHINFYPSKKLKVDITNKRNVDNNLLINYYLNNYGIQAISDHIKHIENWQEQKNTNCKGNIKKLTMLGKRIDKNDYKAFRFVGYRMLTRYRQSNGYRYSYKSEVITSDFYLSVKEIKEKIKNL